MAITNTQRQSFGASAASASSASYTPPANSRVWIWAVARGASAAMPTVTNDLGNTFIAAGAGLDGGTCVARLFYLDVGATPAAMVITVSSAGATQCGGDIVDTTGHNASWTAGNLQYATEAAGDPSLTMSSFAAGSACLTFHARASGSGLTFPSGYSTLLALTTVATNLLMAAAHDLASPATSIAWVGGGIDAVAAGIEIKEAGAPAAAARSFGMVMG
jgi:hypothetical protein